jgi:hypothetical protein
MSSFQVAAFARGFEFSLVLAVNLQQTFEEHYLCNHSDSDHGI